MEQHPLRGDLGWMGAGFRSLIHLREYCRVRAFRLAKELEAPSYELSLAGGRGLQIGRLRKNKIAWGTVLVHLMSNLSNGWGMQKEAVEISRDRAVKAFREAVEEIRSLNFAVEYAYNYRVSIFDAYKEYWKDCGWTVKGLVEIGHQLNCYLLRVDHYKYVSNMKDFKFDWNTVPNHNPSEFEKLRAMAMQLQLIYEGGDERIKSWRFNDPKAVIAFTAYIVGMLDAQGNFLYAPCEFTSWWSEFLGVNLLY